MSFITALDKLKDTIEDDTALTTYCTTNFGKVQTVKRMYKKRAEIDSTELPIFLITRPTSEKTPDSNIAGTSDDLVRMYIGFFCEDAEAAQDILLNLEKAIDSAIMKDPTLGGLVEYVYPGSSANDEGAYHPVYFMVKEMHVHREVIWGDSV